VEVRYIDERRERIHFFASRLKYSRWVEVSVVPNCRDSRAVDGRRGVHFTVS
jgi:hypothetical protein